MTTELDLADLGLPANLKLEIEGKLKELDVYIDEELPDYILVLLANKKSQIQMCKDLRLFFGSLTETFVQWVHTRVKDLRAEEEEKQNSSVRRDSGDISSSEIKSKRNRKSSSHSEKSDSTNQTSKVSPGMTSPKKPDSSVRDPNSASLRKRKSRSPDQTKFSKPRMQQEGEHLASTKHSSADKQSTQQTNLIQNNAELNKTSDNKDLNTKNAANKLESPPPPDRGQQLFTAVTPPPVPEPRAREKLRGRDRQPSVPREGEGARRERHRSRSNPTSPSVRRPPEDQQRRGKNQPRLRYFNRAKSPSPPGPPHPASRKFHQLSSVVKIKSNRDVRSGRNISIQDEQKGSIRLVHKALTEAAASTARSFPRGSGSPKKRRGVLERLGPQVDNSPRLRAARASPQKKRKSVVLDKSVSDSSFHSQQRLSVSDPETDLSRSLDPIKAQFDVIQLSRTDSTCYISDDDLFPPREDSPKRKILSNRAGSDPDSMFDSEEVLPLDDAKRNKRRVMPIKQLNKPKFIVTLDGAQQYRQVMPANSTPLQDMRASICKLDIKQRLGFKPNESSEELTPIYTPPEMSPLSETLKTTIIKPKVMASTPKPIEPVTERCKFFPNCKLGEKCDFHHPSLPCKNFPYCKFNQKCYYLHPDCKFDPYCTKPDCAFLHRHARTNSSFQNHFKNTYSYTADSKSAFPARSQLTWTPGQKIVKEKVEETGRHISERKFALEEVQTVIIPKTES